MLKQAVFVLLLVSILLSSCSKSGDSGNTGGNTGGNITPPPAYLTHTYYFVQENADGSLVTKQGQVFNYDKVNNIITVYEADTLPAQTFADTITYKLTGDVLKVTHTLSALVQTYYLNAAHTYQDSMWLVNGATEGGYSYKHNFDANGKIANIIQTYTPYAHGSATAAPTSQTTSYTWQNGNVVTVNNPAYPFYYTYDETALAAPADPIMSLYSPGQSLFTAKNIKKTGSFINPYKSSHQTDTYRYDDKGRVITTTGTSSADGMTTLGIYTYY